MRYISKPDMEGGKSTTNDWNEIFNASSHNVEDLQEIFLRKLETKENEIRVLRSHLRSLEGGIPERKGRPQTAKVHTLSKSFNLGGQGKPVVESQVVFDRPGITSKELSEIFLDCVSSVKPQNILDSGTEHWTKSEKNEMVYKFITNKKVLQIIYDVMAAGQNIQLSQSQLLQGIGSSGSEDVRRSVRKETDMLSASSNNPLSSNNAEAHSASKSRPPKVHKRRSTANPDSDHKRGVSPIIEEENSIQMRPVIVKDVQKIKTERP